MLPRTESRQCIEEESSITNSSALLTPKNPKERDPLTQSNSLSTMVRAGESIFKMVQS